MRRGFIRDLRTLHGMGKRIAILLFIPLLILLVLFGLLEMWIAGYKAVDAKRGDELREQARVAVEKRKARAGDAGQNGALGLPQGLASLPKKPTAADFQAYARELPKLEAALRKPELLFTGDPDPVFLRGLQGSLLAYAATLPPSKALPCDLLALDLSLKVQAQGSSTNLMVGVSMQRDAHKALFELLRAGKLSRSDLKTLAQSLEKLRPDPKTFVARMDEDYLAFWTYTDGQVGANGFSQQILILVPGFVARERRLYQNLYLRDRDSMEKDFKLTGAPTELQKMNDADHAFVVALNYPAYPKIRLQYARALTEFSALRALTSLELTGKMPPDAHDYLAEDGKLVYTRAGKSYTLKSGYQGTDIDAASLKFR